MGPLTPDGNMTLVDDYGAPSQAGKQFITAVTKSGNYFYIIIDRDDNGTETVHFLNMVDEADLLALMDEDAVKEYIAAKDAKDTETVVTETPELTEEPVEPEDTKEEEPKKSSSGALIIVLILALGGAGGYLYFTKIKGKKPQKETVDPEAHREEITLHKVAKDAFSKIRGKIPTIKELNAEYAQVLAEKKKTYSEYRKARQEMKDYQTAKYNIDRFLQTEEQEK